MEKTPTKTPSTKDGTDALASLYSHPLKETIASPEIPVAPVISAAERKERNMLGLAGALCSPKVNAGASSDQCDRAIESSAGAFVTDFIADHYETGPKNTVRAFEPWIEDYI